VHRVGTLMGYTKGLNECRKADLVLVDIGRIICILEEHVSNTAKSLMM
jgi:hypothetical protein